jgi:hypothetical protein
VLALFMNRRGADATAPAGDKDGFPDRHGSHGTRLSPALQPPPRSGGYLWGAAWTARTGGSDAIMLKGLDPLLNADLLYVLAAMGHGDELALVDKNFPAVSLGARVIRLEGVDAPRVLEAILSVMPLDDMLDTP